MFRPSNSQLGQTDFILWCINLANCQKYHFHQTAEWLLLGRVSRVTNKVISKGVMYARTPPPHYPEDSAHPRPPDVVT